METNKIDQFSLESRLEIARLYKLGYGRTRISKILGICGSKVGYWTRRYAEFGEGCLVYGRRKTYPQDFKLLVARDVLENQLSFEGASMKYQVAPTCIKRWVKGVVDKGYGSFIEQKRGRPRKYPMKSKLKKASPSQAPSAREKELERQLQNAKMEIEYLKKLRALVQDRLKREQSRKPKSSKN